MLQKATDLSDLLEPFFYYLSEEEFEQGVVWAKKQFKLNDGSASELVEQLFLKDEIQFEQLPILSEKGNLILFSLLYFQARFLIEETYLYLRAESLINLGIKVLGRLPYSFFNQSLQLFAKMQIEICKVDRGIYTSQPALLSSAVQRMSDILQEAESFKSLQPLEEQYLFDTLLSEEFSCYQLYRDAISIVVSLEYLRWQDPAVMQAKLRQENVRFDQCLSELSSRGKNILSTDLASLWPSLEYFTQNKLNNDGELFVECGKVTLSYYATLSHRYTQNFIAKLDAENHRIDSNFVNLQHWGAARPDKNIISDIWSGLADYDFLNTYTWQLAPLSFSFRTAEITENLHFDVQLTYFSMGIFSLQFKLDIKDLSVSALRHLTTLGTPFALDLDMLFRGQKVSLIDDFVNTRFEQLNNILSVDLHVPGSFKQSVLNYNTVENRFVLSRLNHLYQQVDGKKQRLKANQLQSHFAYPALILPQREISSSLEDWCLRDFPQEQINLNVDCYNRNEFIYCNQYESVIGLTEQPSWVNEQAEEMMLIASIVTNLFHLSNASLSQQLRENMLYENQSSLSTNVTVTALLNRVSLLEQEQKLLKNFSDDANVLLSIINAGSIVSYPDHGRMMQKVFRQMGFEQLNSRCIKALEKIKQRQDTIIIESNRIYSKLKNQKAKRLTQVLSGTMALISVGALKDIFDIINGSKLGITISGGLQVSLVSLFALLMIIYLLNKNDSPSE